jgi:translation initiation factor 3 subunit D
MVHTYVIFHIHKQRCAILLPDKYASQFGSGSQYAYYHDEDESTFHLVDTARVQKPPYQRGRFRQNMRGLRGRQQQQQRQQSQMQSLRGGMKMRER